MTTRKPKRKPLVHIQAGFTIEQLRRQDQYVKLRELLPYLDYTWEELLGRRNTEENPGVTMGITRQATYWIAQPSKLLEWQRKNPPAVSKVPPEWTISDVLSHPNRLILLSEVHSRFPLNRNVIYILRYTHGPELETVVGIKKCAGDNALLVDTTTFADWYTATVLTAPENKYSRIITSKALDFWRIRSLTEGCRHQADLKGSTFEAIEQAFQALQGKESIDTDALPAVPAIAFFQAGMAVLMNLGIQPSTISLYQALHFVFGRNTTKNSPNQLMPGSSDEKPSTPPVSPRSPMSGNPFHLQDFILSLDDHTYYSDQQLVQMALEQRSTETPVVPALKAKNPFLGIEILRPEGDFCLQFLFRSFVLLQEVQHPQDQGTNTTNKAGKKSDSRQRGVWWKQALERLRACQADEGGQLEAAWRKAIQRGPELRVWLPWKGALPVVSQIGTLFLSKFAESRIHHDWSATSTAVEKNLLNSGRFPTELPDQDALLQVEFRLQSTALEIRIAGECTVGSTGNPVGSSHTSVTIWGSPYKQLHSMRDCILAVTQCLLHTYTPLPAGETWDATDRTLLARLAPELHWHLEAARYPLTPIELCCTFGRHDVTVEMYDTSVPMSWKGANGHVAVVSDPVNREVEIKVRREMNPESPLVKHHAARSNKDPLWDWESTVIFPWGDVK